MAFFFIIFGFILVFLFEKILFVEHLEGGPSHRHGTPESQNDYGSLEIKDEHSSLLKDHEEEEKSKEKKTQFRMVSILLTVVLSIHSLISGFFKTP